MITLYIRPGCPYCRHVTEAADKLQIAYEIKDVNEPEIMTELVLRGGKPQMPYLADSETGTEMYESEDIINYLHERFSKE